jgi:hypothetical protein
MIVAGKEGRALIAEVLYASPKFGLACRVVVPGVYKGTRWGRGCLVHVAPADACDVPPAEETT